jgi:hypothetical protein
VFTPSEKPAWKMDLAQVGYANHFGGNGVIGACTQIAFGSNDELVVLNDDGPFAKPNPVRAFVLDTSTGRTVGKRDWLAKSRAPVYATIDGGYAVVTDHGTDLYTPGLKEVIATSAVYVNRASPDGRTLSGWVEHVVRGHAVTTLLDTGTLEPTGIEVVNTNVESISDDRVSTTAYRKGSADASVITKGAVENVVYQPPCKEVYSHFLSHDVLAVEGCDRIDVVTLEGRLLFGLKVSYDTSFAAVSRDGRRFATLERCLSGGDPARLCAERIEVIDLEKKGPNFTVTLRDRPRGEDDGDSGVALSPDGTLLAINTLGVVRLYRLEP